MQTVNSSENAIRFQQKINFVNSLGIEPVYDIVARYDIYPITLL